MEILSLLGTLYSIAIFVVYIVLIGCASKLAVRLGRENGAWVFFKYSVHSCFGYNFVTLLRKNG